MKKLQIILCQAQKCQTQLSPGRTAAAWSEVLLRIGTPNRLPKHVTSLQRQIRVLAIIRHKNAVNI